MNNWFAEYTGFPVQSVVTPSLWSTMLFLKLGRFFGGNIIVVFTCKSIHFKDDIFRATQLNHHLSERRIADKSIMNVFILFLSNLF